MANSVVHFEIFASDLDQARQFYQQVFGWHFEPAGFPDFFHIHLGVDGDAGLRLGALAKRQRQKADAEASTNAFRCTISVKSLKDTLAAFCLMQHVAAADECARTQAGGSFHRPHSVRRSSSALACRPPSTNRGATGKRERRY
jgi:predicted enzyme related to lactoylglutathione lyase